MRVQGGLIYPGKPKRFRFKYASRAISCNNVKQILNPLFRYLLLFKFAYFINFFSENEYDIIKKKCMPRDFAGGKFTISWCRKKNHLTFRTYLWGLIGTL